MRRLLGLVAAVSVLSCGGAAPDEQSSESAATQRPQPPAATIVLLHGWGGFKRSGELNYFTGVAEQYRALGATVVIPSVSPINTIEERAAQLAAQLDLVPGPLILLAHSQGGLDARYLVSRLGYDRRVRAVVTIATPHHGTPVGDVLAGLVPAPVRAGLDELVEALDWNVDGIVEMSDWYMRNRFNPSVPDKEGVAYWSWSGKAAPFARGAGNGDLHAALLPGWTLLEAFHQPGDGVVPEASAHWGVFQGQLPADHLTEINHTHGVRPVFDAPGFYRALLGRFHEQGW